MFVLFCCLVATALATSHCYSQPRNALLPCFNQTFDQNHDGLITIVEIDAFLLMQKTVNCPRHSALFYEQLSGQMFMSICDANKDGVLTVADWNSANSCAKQKELVIYLCELCEAYNNCQK